MQATEKQPCDGKPQGIRVKLNIKAYEPCSVHGDQPCACEKKLVGEVEKEHDLTCKALAQLIMLNILHSAQIITDTSNTGNSESVNTACTSPLIAAGTSGTSATFADHVLGTETETVSATVGSISSNTFAVTGTITAGANRAYQEVGIRVTANSHLYLLTHDTFSTLNVSNTGTLAVTYTFTFT
jgi:hypothetical protein